MRMQIRTEAGYTLVEVMVAMAVLIIGIVALLPMIAINIRSNLASRTYSIANFLAQEKLEKVRSWPLYDDISPTVGPYGITDNNLELFSDEFNVAVKNWAVNFTRKTKLLHNGYTTSCNGILFGSSVDEGTFTNGAAMGLSLNTGNVDPCGGGGYRGEDFKMVRVEVEWVDPMGFHQLTRNMYIARF